MTKNKTDMKQDKLAEAFMKFMTDNGATFIDVTPKKTGRKIVTKENYLPDKTKKLE